MEIIDRFFVLPRQSFFLFGPRGTGKSTWLKAKVPEALFVDLLQPDVYRSLVARPERLSEMVHGESDKQTIVIDEIQRIPELLNVVHYMMQSDKKRRFILTGSSARKIRRGGVDLLAGRALNKSLHPFMAAELKEFKLEKALQIGLLPLVITSEEPNDVLQAYIQLYLKEEVQMEGLTRNIGNFARFMEAVSFCHAGVLNTSNIARECEVERKTVEGYIEILEDLLISFKVPVFSKKAKRETSVHPKFYFFDAGVYRSLRPKGPLDKAEEIEGCAFEGLIAQHLRAWIAYSSGNHRLYFWRTRSGVEVDFIIYGDTNFLALEVKNSAKIRPADLMALKAFKSDYPECKSLMIYRGKERLRINDILCVPAEDFLLQIRADKKLM